MNATYEVDGFTNEQIGRLMSEVGCADRIERIKRLMWEAQQVTRRTAQTPALDTNELATYLTKEQAE